MAKPTNPTPATEALPLDLTDLRGAIAEYLTRRGYAATPLHLERVAFTVDASGAVTGATATVREARSR